MASRFRISVTLRLQTIAFKDLQSKIKLLNYFFSNQNQSCKIIIQCFQQIINQACNIYFNDFNNHQFITKSSFTNMPRSNPIVFFFFLLLIISTNSSFLSTLLRIQGPLSDPEDPSPLKGQFVLTVFRNETYHILVEEENQQKLEMVGDVSHRKLDIMVERIVGLHYTRDKQNKNEVRGTLIRSTCCWLSYKITVRRPHSTIQIKGEGSQQPWLIWIALLLFMLVGPGILPLTQKKRDMLLYNIKHRTHPVYLTSLLLKLLLVGVCYLLIAYYVIMATSFWIIVPLVVGYFFAFTPSFFHAGYILLCLQKAIRDHPSLIALSPKLKQGASYLITLIIAVALLCSIVYVKDVWFYVLMNLCLVYQYCYSILSRKYAFGNVIIYDLVLTLMLTMFSVFMPICKFVLLQTSTMMYFWGYFCLLMIVGRNLMFFFIEEQVEQQAQLQQFKIDTRSRPKNIYQQNMQTEATQSGQEQGYMESNQVR